MAKKLVKIVNLNTGVEFIGKELNNPHLITHAETNADAFELIFMDYDENSDKQLSVQKLMGYSVKKLLEMAAQNNIALTIPVSHLTKSEIANVIIEGMKHKK